MLIRRYVGVCIMLALNSFVSGQPLDWSGDTPVFATSENERNPAMTIMPASRMLRALCVSEGLTLCMKVSMDDGASWGACATLLSPVQAPQVRAAADRQYEYVLLTGSASANKTLFRFGARDNNWQAALQHPVAPAGTGYVIASAIMSDEAAQLGDPYLNLCWAEREPQTNNYSGWFVQSRDRGQTFQPEHELFAFQSSDVSPDGIDVAVSWEDGDERLIVAAPVDRAGSIPEEIRVFTSEDQGATWGDSTAVDEATFPQREPSLAAFGNMVLLAYSRRVNAAIQRDIFFSYSPDGGVSFSPPIALTDSMADEHNPRIAVSSTGEMFYVLYLADDGSNEPATVFVREGSMAAPWVMSEPMLICEPGNAVRDGGLSVSAGPLGVAAMWTSRFPLGDTDVQFDASWRGAKADEHFVVLLAGVELGQNYPNPFNGSTVLPLALTRGMDVNVVVDDLLGRHVIVRHMGFVSAGQHRVLLDLSAFPSGVYWSSVRDTEAPARKMILIR